MFGFLTSRNRPRLVQREDSEADYCGAPSDMSTAAAFLTAGSEPEHQTAGESGALELVHEAIRSAHQTEEDSSAASNSASMVVMNVRMVSGMWAK